TAAGDLDKVRALQLLDELADPRLAHAHVGGEPFLAREATVVVPGVMQKHRIGDLRSKAQRAIFQDEIRNLGEPAASNGIVGRQLDIALSENIANVSRLRWH